MRLVITNGYEESARLTALHIARTVQEKPNALLGFATGTTPIPVYGALVEMVKKGEVDFSAAYTVNLDEYAGLPGSHPQSYRYFMNQHLFAPAGIQAEHVTIPQGDAPDPHLELERLRRFSAAHRTDLQLLSIGVNGHIGFNEPDEIFHDSYHLVHLTEQTIKSNARLFSSIDEVPTQAFTMGVGDIMKAKSIVFIATGENKKSAIRTLVEEGPVTPQVQATILKFHPDCTLYLDKDLMAGITPALGVVVEHAN